ncbi:MAG: hypothetical protein ABI947_16090 [Chloroflexota bacterium]
MSLQSYSHSFSFPFGGIQLEFVANHSLETCIELLSRQQTVPSWRNYLQGQRDFDFNLISSTPDRCEFIIYRRLARFEVKLKGMLQKLSGNSTLVVGTVNFSESMFLILIPLLAVTIIGMIIGIVELATYGRCFIGVFALLLFAGEVSGIVTLRRHSIELVRLIEETLK